MTDHPAPPDDTAATTLDVPTTHGTARVHLRGAARRVRGALVLGHGAGGGVDAPDLREVTDVAVTAGWLVALVEQPYRVQGRRVPPRAPTLDVAWEEVVAALLAGPAAGLPLVVGGRSSGARVACRTAARTGAAAVLCLAFPVRPPGRPDAPDRLPELAAVPVPVLVVQGATDPFGRPPAGAGFDLVVVDGDHSLRRGLPAVREAVDAWLRRLPLPDVTARPDHP